MSEPSMIQVHNTQSKNPEGVDKCLMESIANEGISCYMEVLADEVPKMRGAHFTQQSVCK